MKTIKIKGLLPIISFVAIIATLLTLITMLIIHDLSNHIN